MKDENVQFLDGLVQYIPKNEFLVFPKFKNQTKLTVIHSASTVIYETREFILKNKNELVSSVSHFVNSSRSEIQLILQQLREISGQTRETN